MLRCHAAVTLALVLGCASRAQASPTLSATPDTLHWTLEGRAEPDTFLGRPCLHVEGGAAILKGVELRAGVIDVDVATNAARGFFGFQFRIAGDGANGEWVYLRTHKSGLPDAMQYTPVFNTGANWQIYNGPGFTGAVDIPKNTWFHLRLVVAGAQAKLYVGVMDHPALDMTDLKSGIQKGGVALHVFTGATYFSNFTLRATPDAAWQRHRDPLEPVTLLRRAGAQSRTPAHAGRE